MVNDDNEACVFIIGGFPHVPNISGQARDDVEKEARV